MPPNLKTFRALLLYGLLLALQAGSGLAESVERLQYQVSYRGAFSLGKDVPIADLVLQTRLPGGVAELGEARLEVSSSAYPLVEALYPIRYRFRSWNAPRDGGLIGFEDFEQTNRRRHRLYLRDRSALGVQHFDLERREGRSEMAQLDKGVRPDTAAPGGALLDRLGMLQWLRTLALHDQAEYSLPVTNGRERFVYRVRVEGSERLVLAGTMYPAWKLRFDGYQRDADGTEQIAHRSVFVWLSRSPGQAPLRAEARYPVGLFRIELRPGPGKGQVALAEP